MAAPPYNLDISDPTDGSLGSAFPANERTFRDNVNSYINTEHDINTGYHMFQILTTAQRTALGSPPHGMIVWTTDASPVTMYINTGTAGAPVWTAIFPGGMKSSGALTGSGAYTLLATAVKVTGIAGGGGGGAGGTVGNNTAGGGGGSGSWFICWLTGLTIGQTITYSVGTGGSAGVADAGGGGNGNTTSISNGTATITTRTANGGQGGGGGGATDGAGGAGGVVATGAAGDLLGLGGNGFTFGGTSLVAYASTQSMMHPFGSGAVGGTVHVNGTAGTAGTLFFEYVA